MNKKNRKIVKNLASLTFLIPALVSCNGNQNKEVHEHAFYPVEAKEATCVSTGNIAYDQCIYCKKIEVNGEEKTADDVILPVDVTAHKHLKDFDAVAPTCIASGNEAYSYCEDCGKYVIDGKTVDSNESALLPLEPNGHQLEEFAYKAPTCGIEGYNAHMECTLCKKCFINNEEVNKDRIFIPATKEHVYDENGADNVCKKAFQFDKQTFDEKNAFSMSPTSRGIKMDASQGKTSVSEALIKERMKFITQISGETSTKVENIDGDIVLTHMNESNNNPQAFTRIAPGIRNAQGEVEAYVGKFLFSMDVTFKDEVYVSRVGAMITNSGFTVITGNGVSQAKLLGRGGANSEGKADRSFEAGVTYRFVYSMETTDETQLIQLFGCSLPTTITYSNIHIIPLSSPKGKVNSTFLYFGKTDMKNNEFHVDPAPEPEPTPVKKSVEMPNGLNFFDANNWTKATDNDKEKVGDSVYEEGGSLSFSKDSAARVNLFHVKANDGTLIHVADNASKKGTLLSEIYDTEYSYSLEMLVNGSFDMGILAGGAALNKSVTSQAAFYLSFAENGSITMSQNSGVTTSVFTDRFFISAGSYEQKKTFTFTIKLHRTDANTLKAQFLINGTVLKFQGEDIVTEDDYSFSFDEEGVFTSSKYLSKVGMGQRLSILPTEDSSKVTVSNLKIETKKVETPIEPKPENKLSSLETQSPYTMYNGLDLFASNNWLATDGKNTPRTNEEIIDADGSLKFEKDTSSRIDFFHVAKNGTAWRHLADKKTNILGLDILNKDYRFDLDVASTGAFDLMMFGNAAALSKNDKNNSFYLSVNEEGALSFIFCYGKSSVSTFTSEAKFDFTKKQRVSIIANRVSEGNLDISIYLDYVQIPFKGDATTPLKGSTLSVDENGKLSLANLLSTVGLGQRLGVMPQDSSMVKVSGAAFLPTPETKK